MFFANLWPRKEVEKESKRAPNLVKGDVHVVRSVRMPNGVKVRVVRADVMNRTFERAERRDLMAVNHP